MRVDSHPASRNRIRALVLLLASTSFIAVCVEDGVNLSPNYNTLRYRSIVIETQ